MDKNYFLNQVYDKIKLKSTNYKAHYHDAGSCDISKNFFYEKKNKIKWLGYEIPKERAIDIDDENDWRIAEALFELKKKKFN